MKNINTGESCTKFYGSYDAHARHSETFRNPFLGRIHLNMPCNYENLSI